MVQRQDFWEELSVYVGQKLIIQRCRESVEKNCKTKRISFKKSKHDMYDVLLYFFCNEKVSVDKNYLNEGGLELLTPDFSYVYAYVFFSFQQTLDQLPLTNPEHFGTPVIGKKTNRGRRSNHM